jgi:hypothetical protein
VLSRIAAGEGELAELAKESIAMMEPMEDGDDDRWFFSDPLMDATANG